MLRGLYTAAAGMIAQQRKHDTVTNNIANINTPGYKQVNAISRSFPEMLVALTAGQAGDPSVRNIGRLNTGVLAEEDPSLYVQGDLMETRQGFDFAIASDIQDPGLNYNGTGMAFTAEGERVFQKQAFFTLQDGEGQFRFTRNGNFAVDELGQLVTPEGYRVLGSDGQPLVLRDAAGTALSDVTVTESGRFLDPVNGQPVLNAAGQPIAFLLSRVDNPNRLVREGNGVYRLNAGEEEGAALLVDGPGGVPHPDLQTLTEGHQLAVRQGYLERSNVDPAQAMIDMNSALRAYETNQKMVQFYDRSLEKAVNEVGRV